MANLKEIRDAKRQTRKVLLEEIKKNPNKGMYEFFAAELNACGVEVENVNDKDEIDAKIKKLPAKKRKKIRDDSKAYGKVYVQALKDATKGKYDGLKNLPKVAIDTILKGAGVGISAAAVVNTLLPNLVPALGGYLAATLPAEWVVKTGLLLASAALPVSTTGAIVVGAGAAVGATAAIIGRSVVGGAKGIGRGIKKCTENKKKTNVQNHRAHRRIDRER